MNQWSSPIELQRLGTRVFLSTEGILPPSRKSDSTTQSRQGSTGVDKYHKWGPCHNCGEVVILLRHVTNCQNMRHKVGPLLTVHTAARGPEQSSVGRSASQCRLHCMQRILDDESAKVHLVTTNANEHSKIVGPTVLLDIKGVPIELLWTLDPSLP